MEAETPVIQSTQPDTGFTINRRSVGIGLLVSLVLALFLGGTYGWRQAALFLVGVGAGLVLYHAAFGFTSAWRRMIVDKRGAGLRAQMIMLAATVLIFLPLINGGELWGQSLRGNVSPLGLSVVVGAFLFGLGMQMGGGCASGTLFTVGGGSVRMMFTLLAFIVGSVLGAWHLPGWQQAPALAPVSLLGKFGLAGALAISLALFAAVWMASSLIERRRYGGIGTIGINSSPSSWIHGPWPLVAGALGLAAVNSATLILAGRPWGVTSGFALWGSKVVSLVGIDVAAWPYWQSASRAAALENSVFSDVTSVMNFGIILGALMAAGLAGRYAPSWRVPTRSLVAALLGGILLGYGARIAYGCNIGAFFSGVSSSSLHGWLWFVAAFIGNAVGTRMRPWFGLANN